MALIDGIYSYTIFPHTSVLSSIFTVTDSALSSVPDRKWAALASQTREVT